MRILEFKVDKQVLRKQPGCDFSDIVANSVGYLKAKFHFSGDEWIGCKKVASFWVDDKEYPVLLDDNNMCDIPSESLVGNAFKVSLTGAKSTGYRINTTKFKVRQEVH